MPEIRVGVVGTGFIGSHFISSLARHEEMMPSRVLTRRRAEDVSGFPESVLTSSIDDLISHSDVIVECSGDPIWATDVVSHSVQAGIPVVTMNTEFHITTGSAFVGKGLVTEAEGDQPGVLAALHEDVVAMGFQPIAYGNMKGFLDLDPTPENMEYWATKQGISIPMVTSFTDGTKVQAEQILVGNFFGATIGREGMRGSSVADLQEGVEQLALDATDVDRPITDFIVSPGLPHGVFIVATHDSAQAAALEYFKLGPGPNYTIVRPNIFVHLEIVKTIKRVLREGTVLLDNSASPELSLAAVAKADLQRGLNIGQAIGSFEFRGRAVRINDEPSHVPIGLLFNATLERDVAKGQVLEMGDVSLPESLATKLWADRSPSMSS